MLLKIVYVFFLLLCISCISNNSNEKTVDTTTLKAFNLKDSCWNLKLYINSYANENVIITYNKQIILDKKLKYAGSFKKMFCLPRAEKCIINISTLYLGKKYIDTTFIIKDIHTKYNLIIYPPCFKRHLREKKYPPRWDYIPIDSSYRKLELLPDSIFKDCFAI